MFLPDMLRVAITRAKEIFRKREKMAQKHARHRVFSQLAEDSTLIIFHKSQSFDLDAGSNTIHLIHGGLKVGRFIVGV